MFETLYDVDWKQKNAEQIPEMLTKMATADSVFSAYERFKEEILHAEEEYGYYYEYDVDAVMRRLNSGVYSDILPFLIEVLASEKLTKKHFILYILDRFHDFIGLLRLHNRDLTHAQALVEQLWQYHEVIFTFLRTGNKSEKKASMGILSKFNQHANSVLTQIIDILPNEKNEHLRMLILDNIWSELLKYEEARNVAQLEFIPFLHKLVVNDPSHVVRVSASVIMIDILEKNVPEDVYNYIITTLRENPTKSEPEYSSATLHSITQVKLLMKLDPDQIYDDILEIFDQSENKEVVIIIWALILLIAFCADNLPKSFSTKIGESIYRFYALDKNDKDFEIPMIDLQQLTENQKRAIRLMIRNETIWHLDIDFLEKFNLPTTRDGLLTLVK